MTTDNSKLIQGTQEWKDARCGKITGSRFKDVLAKKDGVTRAKYMRELLLERKTGICVGGYFDKNMANGQNIEPQARAYYEKVTGFKVEQVGFINSQWEEFRDYVGVSPDGLVGDEGGLEIKCPTAKVHLEYIAKNTLPSQYVAQVQGNMWITKRVWWDFESFCPEVEAEPYWCIRVFRDQSYANKLAAAVDVFIQEMVELQRTQIEVDPQLLIDVTEGYSNETDWQVKLKNEIQGKVRMHVTCAMLQANQLERANTAGLKEDDKQYINDIVDFIVTGV